MFLANTPKANSIKEVFLSWKADEFYGDYWRKRVALGHILTEGTLARMRIASGLVDEVLPPKGKVLDIGCGEGVFAQFMKEKRKDAVLIGIDVAEEAVRLADQHYHLVRKGDVEDSLPEEVKNHAPYDVVVCLEVLEHLFNPLNALRRVVALLKGGGYVVASFPNFVHWRTRLRVLMGQLPYGYWLLDPAEHPQIFNLTRFKKLLKEAGLHILRVKGIYSKRLRWVRILPFCVTVFAYQIVTLAKKE